MTHFEFIEFKNYRIFKKETHLRFSPISLLTGPNSSGKSSVFKAFLLLKDNFSKGFLFDRLDFRGAYHHLGQFRNVKTKSSNSKLVEFTIPFNFFEDKNGDTILIGRYYELAKNPWHAKFQFELLPKKENGLLTKLVIYKNKARPLLLFERTKELGDFNYQFKTTIDFDYIYSLLLKTDEIDKHLVKYSKKYPIKNDFTLFRYFDEFENEITPNKELRQLELKLLREYFKNNKVEFDNFNDYEEFLCLEGGELGDILINLLFEEIRKADLGYNIVSIGGDVFFTFYEFLLDFFKKAFEINALFRMDHLPSIRGNIQRLYYNQDVEIPFNQLLLKFLDIKLEKKSDAYSFLNTWLKKFQIGDSLIVNRFEGTATSIYVKKGKFSILLADLGFGITQLLAILLKILIAKHERTTLLLIEEPEANLHPNFQSLLADMFYDAYKTFNIQFILESHSEYLIRKFQYLVGKGQVNVEDLNIHYFDQNGYSKEIKFLEDGRLDKEFGPGFFDEADNLAIELFELRRSQLN